MPKVKVLKTHTNNHGEDFVKRKGSTYEHPSPAQDVAAGFVKVIDDDAAKVRGREGNGRSSVSAKERDGKKSN